MIFLNRMILPSTREQTEIYFYLLQEQGCTAVVDEGQKSGNVGHARDTVGSAFL
jgi:hypothetical protein